MCQQIIITHDGVKRNCKLKEFSDGWCRIHHPQTIEEDLIRDLKFESMKVERSENAAVGAFLRWSNEGLFEKIFDDVKKKTNFTPYRGIPK